MSDEQGEMTNDTCTCADYGTEHEPTCPARQTVIEPERTAHTPGCTYGEMSKAGGEERLAAHPSDCECRPAHMPGPPDYSRATHEQAPEGFRRFWDGTSEHTERYVLARVAYMAGQAELLAENERLRARMERLTAKVDKLEVEVLYEMGMKETIQESRDALVDALECCARALLRAADLSPLTASSHPEERPGHDEGIQATLDTIDDALRAAGRL